MEDDSASICVPCPRLQANISASGDLTSRACANCARAKVKCVWSQGRICQRCSKSDLQCAIPPIHPRKKRGKSTRVRALEQKVDGILSMLAEGRLVNNESNASRATHAEEEPNQKSLRSVDHSDNSLRLSGCLDEASIAPPVGQRAHLQVNHQSEQYIDIAHGFRMLVTEADAVLREYMTAFLQHFPFVPIPHHDSQELLNERPLLLKTILSICRPQPYPARAVINRWIREQVAHQVVVLNEKRLELLQVILVSCAWTDLHSCVDGSDTGLLQLAVGLAGDLRLHRPLGSPDTVPMSLIEAAATLRGKVVLKDLPPHNNADRRAFLGLYYLTSVVSEFHDRIPYPKYTEYHNECCSILSQSREYPTDLLLCQVIHMQRLTAKIRSFHLERNFNRGLSYMPHALLISTINRELEELVARQPDGVTGKHLLSSHYCHILIRLYEPAIFEQPTQIADQTLTRSRRMWTCLEKVKSCYETHLQVPPEIISAMTFVPLVHIGGGNVTVGNLLLQDSPGWDAATARTSFDFQDITQRLVAHFEAADRASGPRRKTLEDGKGLFMMYSEKWGQFKRWYLGRLPMDPPVTGEPAMVQVPPQDINEVDFEFWQMLFDSGHNPVSWS